MQIKGLIDEDFVNYKKVSMFISTSKCSFKCDKECGRAVCQNSSLAHADIIDINDEALVTRFLDNPISNAVVIGGLEPFDTFNELYQFIYKLRKYTDDDVVIYTGYYEKEIQEYIDKLRKEFANIIVKFGRFIPDQDSHYDKVLGIKLASDNQYGKQIC